MLTKRRTSCPAVKPGDVFERVADGQVIETAQVLDVSQGPVGIPHVRFRVHHERTESADDLRTLALASFHQLFHERFPA